MNKELLEYFNGDELAANVWLSKYALEGEVTPDDMHKRLAKEFGRIEDDYYEKGEQRLDKGNLSDYGSVRPHLQEEEIYNLFKDFKYIIPQGRVMAGLGVLDSYRSLSNCLRLPPPKDSYSSIMYTDTMLVSAAKRGCGYGLGLSELRPRNTKVENAASSSTGAASFMERFSFSTREVAQQGRRGACLLDIDVKHPDVLEFINMKKDKTKVTGANISVKLWNDFMEAVEKDEDYNLVFKNEVYTTVKARDIYNQIVENAWENAEPGQFFWDRVIDYDPCSVYEEYYIDGTNACFTGDHCLLTSEGFKSLLELENCEIELINSEGEIKNGKVWRSGFKEIVQVSTWGNHLFKCTPNHLFKTTDGDYEAKDLKGKRIIPFYTIKETYSEFTNLGFLQGDGNLGRLSSTKHLGLEVNIGENDEDIKPLFNVSGQKRKFYVNGYNTLLKKLGFSSEQLPYRNLPSSIDSWEIEELKDFLTGLFSANGGIIKGHRVSFKSTCKELINNLKEILYNKLSIESYITTNKSKNITFENGTYLCKESYDLNISKFEDILKFAENISFVHTYKKENLKELILQKAPKVKNVIDGGREYVYDFSITEGDNHWGVISCANKSNLGFIIHNCGEQPMSVYDTCRLICLNLFSFVDNPFTTEAEINYQKLYEISYEQLRLGDDLVDLEIEYVDRIINKVKEYDGIPKEEKQIELALWENVKSTAINGRRVGCGITALGDMLAAINLSYDSDEALKVIDKVMATKMRAELDASIDLSILRGSFKGADVNKEFAISPEGTLDYGFNLWYQFVLTEFPEQAYRMAKYNRRNTNFSTIAPTGSVSILSQTCSGCEPLFQPYYMRRKKVNPSDTNIKIDFTDANGDTWQEFPVLHPKFKEWIKTKSQASVFEEEISNEDLKAWFEESPWYKSTANDIDWLKRVEIQSILQKYTTSAISSTVNVPETITKEEVWNIYFEAWKKGLKGITLYRSGSRDGVLVTESKKEENFIQRDAPKRPKELKADVFSTSVKGQIYNVYIGIFTDKPYEVFAKKGSVIVKGEGLLIKQKRGQYDFIQLSNSNSIHSVITDNMSSEEETICRLVSTSLRHGAEIKFVVEQLNKTEGDMTSFSKAIGRVLKKYIPDEAPVSGTSCPSCGSENLIYQEGCNVCKDCGYSGCS